MCVSLPESLLAFDSCGRALRGGLFCVKHEETSERLIDDPRLFNEVEGRMDWIRLPLGSQLMQFIVPEGFTRVASGHDLSNYFHCLRHHPSWWPRNAFTRALDGVHFPELGGVAGVKYRGCFKWFAWEAKVLLTLRAKHTCAFWKSKGP